MKYVQYEKARLKNFFKTMTEEWWIYTIKGYA